MIIRFIYLQNIRRNVVGVTGRPLAVAGQCICTHVIVHWSLIGCLTVFCMLVTGPWKYYIFGKLKYIL